MHGDFGNVWVQGCETLRLEECVSGGRDAAVEAMGWWAFRGVAGSWGAGGLGDETVDCTGWARHCTQCHGIFVMPILNHSYFTAHA